ncbi:MAG: hypothetical protein OWS74_06675, partial [Firmicutes bacterium]|nr:hypothetical protein [Bacillota bacterium]
LKIGRRYHLWPNTTYLSEADYRRAATLRQFSHCVPWPNYAQGVRIHAARTALNKWPMLWDATPSKSLPPS